MSEKPDESQKTEDPTQKRLDDARRKGDAPKSQEVPAAFALAGAVVVVIGLLGPAGAEVGRAVLPFLDRPHAMDLTPQGVLDVMRHAAFALIAGFAMIGGVLAVFAVAGNVAQAKPVLTAEKMKPKLSKLSPLEGAKRLFGPQALANFAKGLAKLAIVGLVIVWVLWPDREMLAEVLDYDPSEILAFAKSLTVRIVSAALMAMIVVAAADYAWQRQQWMKRQRMTKQEVKDEHKDAEGDPHVKAKIRQLRMERARKRMMAEVPNATVVVMNPTHYAVALKYSEGQRSAPICVAKGQDAVALRIRDKAKEHGVPVVQNPPLARALYASVELEAEIPVEHYEAVAKVIGFVYRTARDKARAAAPRG